MRCPVTAALTPKSINTEDGLSNSTVTAMFRDHNGLMWIGTRYGLNMYDNTSVTSFFADECDHSTLPADGILHLFEDARGSLWVITDRGTAIYDRASRRFNTVEFNGRPVEEIRSFCLRDDGVMLGGRGVIFIYKYDTSSLQTADITGGSGDVYTSIVPMRAGRYALATGSDGVWLYDVMSRKATPVSADTGHAPVTDLAVDSRGCLWIATLGSGVTGLDRNLRPAVRLSKAGGTLASDTVRDIMPFGEKLLFATEAGISQWSVIGQRTPMRLNSLAGSGVMCLYTDRTGNCYAGTNDFGAVALTPDPVTSLRPHSDGEPANFTAFATDGEGEVIWCGSDGKGLFRLPVSDPSLLPVKIAGVTHITSLMHSGRDRLLIACRGPEIRMIDRSTYTSHPVPAVLDRIVLAHSGRDITFDLFPVSDGVTAVVSDTVYFIGNSDGIPHTLLSAIPSPDGKLYPLGIRDGELLLQGDGGLFGARPGRDWIECLTDFDTSDATAAARGACFDGHHTIYYTSGSSIRAFDLESDSVQSIKGAGILNDAVICDGSRLWIAAPREVVLVDGESRWILDRHSGLIPDRMNPHAFLVTPECLVLGGRNGVTYISRPETDALISLAPAYVDISVAEITVDGTDMTDRIRNGTLNLPSSASDVTIRIVEMSPDPRRRKRFRCMIGNGNRDTGLELTGRTIHIRPRYGEKCDIRFACSLPDGTWSEPEHVLTLVVAWPWWVRFSLAAALIAILWACVLVWLRYSRHKLPTDRSASRYRTLPPARSILDPAKLLAPHTPPAAPADEAPAVLTDQTEHRDVKPVTDSDAAWLDKVRSIITGHISDPEFGIEALLTELGIGRTRLHQRIKKLTGQSAGNYITSLRIDHAKELLADQSLTVADVAVMSGYSSQSYFATIFREKTGMTPSQWRSQNN